MIQPAAAPEVSIGACLACNAVILVTPANPNCRLCGQPPGATLSFEQPAARVAPFEAPPPEPAPEPESPTSEEPLTDHDIFIGQILDYLDHGRTTEELLRIAFIDAGAEFDTASTAVGRLRAVRDLIRELAPREESAIISPAPSAQAPEAAPPANSPGDAAPTPPPAPSEGTSPPADSPAETPPSQ